MSRSRRLFVSLSALCSAAVVAHTLLASEGWGRRARVRHDLGLVTQDVERYTLRVRELRARVDAVKTRRAVQERVVRHQLSYVRPGDLVVDLD